MIILPSEFTCPVCGFAGLDTPAYDPGTTVGSFEICPSCGFQFGVTDGDRGIPPARWRQEWIDGGMRWWSRSMPPDEWDPQVQLRGVC